MEPQDNPTVIIYALIPNGEKVPIQASVTETILKIKMKLFIQKDIPVETFNFTWLNQELDDSKTIDELWIQSEQVLEVVLKKNEPAAKSRPRYDYKVE